MSIRPYLELMRVQKPAGWLLFLWPFLFGLTMAAYNMRVTYDVYSSLVIKFTFGSFLMRSFACTINDILDRELDASVERTKDRPLPSGRISVLAASMFAAGQFGAGIPFFATVCNPKCGFTALHMALALSIYPVMKRITYWPQAWLGIAINLGYIVSWFSVCSKSLDSWSSSKTICCMLLSLWCWTMVYDTVYGCQDRKDDIKAGIWSTAVLFGDAVVPAVKIFATAFLGALLVAGKLNDHGAPYFSISAGGTAIYLVRQFRRLDVESTASCWEIFKGHAFHLGAIVYSGMLLDYFRVMSYATNAGMDERYIDAVLGA